MPNFLKLLRRRPLSEKGTIEKKVEEVVTFINRELLPFLQEFKDSSQTSDDDDDADISDLESDISILQSEPFVTTAASATLSNESVATASTEITPTAIAGVITWSLNATSVAFSKLVDLSGLSVLGRSASTSGVMAAITSTAGSQVLRSNTAGTSVGWESDLSTQHDVSIAAGTYDPYLLPASFTNRDTLSVTITGDVIIRRIRFSDGSLVPSGFIMYLALRDQSGGFAPGFSITILDSPLGSEGVGGSGYFRTPGQVQGTTPGPSYVMQSEEEGAVLVVANGIWRITGGTAAQAITGAVTVPAGNGASRVSSFAVGVDGAGLTLTGNVLSVNGSTSITVASDQVRRAALSGAIVAAVNANTTTFAGILDNGSAENDRTNLNFLSSTSNIHVVTDDAGNDELEITVERAALTGAITATQNSNATLFDTNSSGAGLTGGGTAILAVGAGTGITVNANDVAVTIPLTDGDKGDITVATSGTSFTIDSGVITPEKLASLASSIGSNFSIYFPFTAGAGGSADDVTIFNANAPFAFRILKTLPYISGNLAANTIELRSASGGGGTALSSTFDSTLATEDPAITTPITATTTVAANGSIFIRRSDSAIAGEIICLCVKT